MCLQFDALGGTSMKPRSKRAPHSKRLSIKDLALELAKKHVSFFLRLRASKIHAYTVRVPYPLSLARPVYIALSLVFRLNQRLPTVKIYLISLTLIAGKWQLVNKYCIPLLTRFGKSEPLTIFCKRRHLTLWTHATMREEGLGTIFCTEYSCHLTLFVHSHC